MSGIQKFDATPVRPSTPAYAPGTVAVATVRGVENVRVMAGYGTAEPRLRWVTTDERLVDAEDDGWWFAYDVTDVRPLIVVDLDECYGCWAETSDAAVIVQRLRETQSVAAHAIADQIEQQAREPKPAEPTGLGAVVEDADGRRWMRFERADYPARWYDAGPAAGFPQKWEALNVVRVLSEGVQ